MLEALRYFSENYTLRYDVPVAAMILVGLFYLLRRSRIQNLLGKKRVSQARWILLLLLTAVAALAVENYRATDYKRFDTYINAYEFYHYYIGTKYAREVGYTDMYAASLIADSETGMKWRHNTGTIRNLSNGRHENFKKFLEQADEYKAKFTPERWEEFKKDIVWFKDRLVQGRWDGILRDKGYNGTPVWTMLVGGLLSNRVSTDSKWGMGFLALLDPLLILITFGVVVWAFGWRTALLMIILLGTNYMMKWWHMKGAYLRTDWAMCMVMSVCMIRKKQFAAAGALTGYAALSRIFPAVLLFGIGAKLFWNIIEVTAAEVKGVYERRQQDKSSTSLPPLYIAGLGIFFLLFFSGAWVLLSGVVIPWLSGEEKGLRVLISLFFSKEHGYSPLILLPVTLFFVCLGAVLGGVTLWGLWLNRIKRQYLYFFVAFGVTTASLLGLSHLYWRGTDYWSDYNTKISKHSSDISTWRVGYKYIFMADFGEDFSVLDSPVKEWQPRVRPQWYKERQTEWWRTQIMILVLTLCACMGLKDYRAYIMGFVPLFFLVSPTYYYYIMLLTPLLFFAPRIEYGRYALGLCLMYLTGMAGFWFYELWRQGYGTYYWLSVLVMLMVLYMLALAFVETLLVYVKKSPPPASPQQVKAKG